MCSAMALVADASGVASRTTSTTRSLRITVSVWVHHQRQRLRTLSRIASPAPSVSNPVRYGGDAADKPEPPPVPPGALQLCANRVEKFPLLEATPTAHRLPP